MNTRLPYRRRLPQVTGLCSALALLLSAGCAAPLAQTTVAAQPQEVTAVPSEIAPAANTASPAPPAASVPAASPTPMAATAPYPHDSDRPAFKHVVVAGDTCAGIATKFRTTMDKLVAANGLPDCTQIRVSLELFIPRSVPYDIKLYDVQPGDSFTSIAAAFGLKTETLLWSNADQGPTPDSLRPGQVLLVPPVDGAIHLVQAGDTLAQVANRYHVTTAVIAHYPANDLPSASAALLPGSLLVIPGGRLD